MRSRHSRILSLVVTLVLLGLDLGAGPPRVAHGQQPTARKDYFPSETLDRPLGIRLLSNGNLLITDCGGAFYTLTDAAIMEVNRGGQIVWQYVGSMACPHSAERLPDGSTLISDTSNNRVFRVDSAGQIVWTSEQWSNNSGTLSDGSQLLYPNNADLLANGHLLITDRNNNRVIETTVEGEITWQYSQLNRPHNGHRLENGNTLVCDSENNRVVEINPQGGIVWTFGDAFPLNWPRDAERLGNGNTLITDTRNGRVLEVSPEGQVVWSFSGLALPYEAHRLENGDTLIADGDHRRVVEVNPAGEIVWQFHNFLDSLPAALSNGDFEQDADGDGQPDGWYPAGMNAEGPVTFLWDEIIVEQGQRSATVIYTGAGRAAWLQVVKVAPGQSYQFSGYLRADTQGGLVAYQLWFLDKLGGPISEPLTVKPVLQGTTDWQKASTDVIAPQDAAAVQIWCQVVAGDGQAGFDQVEWREKANLLPLLAGGAGAALLAVAGGAWFLIRRRRRKSAGEVD
jgi:hypothetical protein